MVGEAPAMGDAAATIAMATDAGDAACDEVPASDAKGAARRQRRLTEMKRYAISLIFKFFFYVCLQ